MSFIITTHNYAGFLPQAIESALAQTYLTREIVVIDDGSTDNTESVMMHFATREVEYLHQVHAGPGQARNAGLRVTRGELVCFLDADDVWLPNKTDVQVEHLLSHPELGLVGGEAISCDEHWRQRSVARVPRAASGNFFEALLVKNIVHNPSSTLIRRMALQRIGGFSEIPVGQDWDTWIRIAKVFPIGFVNVPVAKVRRHSQSLSPRHGRFRIDINPGIVQRHLGDVTPAWKRPLIMRRARSVAYLQAGASSVSQGDRSAARKFALCSIWWDPFTFARRKSALFLRAFVSRNLVDLAASLLKDRDGQGYAVQKGGTGRRSRTGGAR